MATGRSHGTAQGKGLGIMSFQCLSLFVFNFFFKTIFESKHYLSSEVQAQSDLQANLKAVPSYSLALSISSPSNRSSYTNIQVCAGMCSFKTPL